MSSVTFTIHTHVQISEQERDSRGGGLNDKAYSTRKHASWNHRRDWSNSTRDRYNGGYNFFGPGWLMPQVLETVTASIIWGICGRMADMPEY